MCLVSGIFSVGDAPNEDTIEGSLGLYSDVPEMSARLRACVVFLDMFPK